MRSAPAAPGWSARVGAPGFSPQLRPHDWVVYATPPFAGPTQVLESLGRHTHRVALSNDRLVSVDVNQVRYG